LKFNPITKKIYTDDGEYLKKMYCPFIIQWNKLNSIDNSNTIKNCLICKKNIIDTAFFNDEQIRNMIKEDKKTCLKINLKQNNIKII